MTGERPLEGLRVVEMGQLLAGPFAGTILGYFGAEVIKVEPPTGDPIRQWREVRDGTSLWYHSLARNKKSVTLDLKSERGQELAFDLLCKADIVVENFRPGAMEDWGLGPEKVKAINPGIIYARISGYGQTGPFSSKPGYASVTEGYGGFRYINGEPGKLRSVRIFHSAIPRQLFTRLWVCCSRLSNAINLARDKWLTSPFTRPSLIYWRVSSRNTMVPAWFGNPLEQQLPASFPPTPTCVQTASM